MVAFDKARAASADGLELDVRFDGDKNVVVFHDSGLERLIGRPGHMEALSADERAKLRVGGEPVPLLAEVLEAFDMEIDVELKSERTGRSGELALATAKVIRDSRRVDQILVSSFDPFALMQLHRHLPDVALAYIFSANQGLPMRRGWVSSWMGASVVHPQHTLCTEQTVRRWHTAGLPINVWTVDDDAELERLALLGIDGVFSNDPGHAIRVFDELLARPT